MQYEDEYKKSNREKAMSSKTGLYWCHKCDHHLVSDGQKCPGRNCKNINGQRRLKTEANARK